MANLPSFSEMQAGDADFTAVDYLHYVFTVAGLNADVLVAFVEIFLPQFVEVDGKLLVSTVGAEARYRKFRSEGQSPDSAQYWANLTLVNGIFGTVDSATVLSVTHLIARNWRFAVEDQYLAASQTVRVIEDHEEDEIFVGLATKWPPYLE